ncbi:hypothetical protein [Janthinobacterium sp. SUN206]|uniref:hypothetical protein n=1 Tax=Janthinobacterium sp. SUN206 TaxID=3014787 RepID=UPI0027141BF7|nr:hypothetical protein [Janthinobacterium sp. SUN206]MDO8065439.1 hypothetical protein [Janthinobacterium sp. SUN206]
MLLNGLLCDLYLHELEIREKIFVRLQLNFGAYVTVVTVMVYMTKTVDYSSPCWAITLFHATLFLTLLPLLMSMRYTLIAFTGYQYVLFPSTVQSVKYKQEAEAYCSALAKAHGSEDGQGMPDVQMNSTKMLDDYVMDSLAACVDRNSEINEQRQATNRKSLLSLFIASLPLVVAACLFVFMDLDASSPRKNFPIEDARLRTSIEQSSDKMKKSIDQLTRDFSNMATNNTPQTNSSPGNSSQSTSPTPAPTQPAPTPPQRPQLRISNESYTEPLPDKSKLIKEGR